LLSSRGYAPRLRRLLDLRGTFAPALRASDNPIAMACLRLFTFRPERPLRSVPFLRSDIVRFTFREAFLLYLRAMTQSPTVSTTVAVGEVLGLHGAGVAMLPNVGRAIAIAR
jgi:hypothetical protein